MGGLDRSIRWVMQTELVVAGHLCTENPLFDPRPEPEKRPSVSSRKERTRRNQQTIRCAVAGSKPRFSSFFLARASRSPGHGGSFWPLARAREANDGTSPVGGRGAGERSKRTCRDAMARRKNSSKQQCDGPANRERERERERDVVRRGGGSTACYPLAGQRGSKESFAVVLSGPSCVFCLFVCLLVGLFACQSRIPPGDRSPRSRFAAVSAGSVGVRSRDFDRENAPTGPVRPCPSCSLAAAQKQGQGSFLGVLSCCRCIGGSTAISAPCCVVLFCDPRTSSSGIRVFFFFFPDFRIASERLGDH